MASSSSAREIPLAELNVSQLNQLSQQLDQELELLQSSMQSLKVAQGKFVECKESLSKLSADAPEVLVPLTGSMYVPGKLTDIETCLIDVGTGYYIEQKLPGAKDYYQRKSEFLTNQLEKIQPLFQDKYRMKEAVLEIIQMKIQSQLAAQQLVSSKS